jgi:hypothetical protein
VYALFLIDGHIQALRAAMRLAAITKFSFPRNLASGWPQDLEI